MMLGELGSVESILYSGLWLSIVGLMILLYGWRRVQKLFFPLLVLAFIVPLPPFINRMLTFNLKMIGTNLAVKILRIFNISVHQTGNIIDLGIDKLQVVDACSGLRYFVPMFLMALMVGYFYNKGIWRKLLLLLIVPPLSIIVNAFRIVLSGLLTVRGHKDWAQNIFHDFSGWFVFMLAGAILLTVALLLQRISSTPPISSFKKYSPREECIGWIRPVVLSFLAAFLFISFGTFIRNEQYSSNVSNRTSLTQFPMEIGNWNGNRHFFSKEIMDELWADDYVSAVYRKPDSPVSIQLLIPYYNYQGTRHTAHAPQSCLLGSGFNLLKSKDQSINTSNGNSIPIRTMLLKQGNTKILASYFFYGRGRVITNPWKNKSYLFWDAITRKRTDGALVRAELLMIPGQSDEEAFFVLSSFIREIWKLLPKFVPV